MSDLNIWTLAPFLAAVIIAASSGAIFKPGDWYETLEKPVWTPPNWVFPLGWSILYLMIAVAGWLAWERAGPENVWLAMAVFGIQLILNAAWSGIFFGLRKIKLALMEVALLWVMIAANIALFFAIDPMAGWLLVPYLFWVTFAASLNAAVLKLNPNTN